jgi:hypothetical protein
VSGTCRNAGDALSPAHWRKTIELRKGVAKVSWSVRALIYESSQHTTLSDDPEKLWEKVKNCACVPRAWASR